MKILVTGATGLLGSNVVRELLKRGQQVRVLVRKESNMISLRGLDIDYFYGDLDDQQRLFEACRGFDYVIHAGAKTPGGETKFSAFVTSNIRGTQNIINAANRAGISRIVYVSSCCVFGGGSLENPGNELSEFTGFRFNSGYINSKYLAYQWVLSQIEKKQLPIVIVNPTLMIGPFDSRPSSGEIILRILSQPVQLCPPGGKNFIDVRDAASATCNALTMGVIGESYLLASENLSFSSFFRKVNNISGRQGCRILVPCSMMNCSGLVGNAIQLMTKHSFPLNFCNARQLSCESYFSGKKAARVLGLNQRPVDKAIRDAIAWFKINGYLETGASIESRVHNRLEIIPA